MTLPSSPTLFAAKKTSIPHRIPDLTVSPNFISVRAVGFPQPNPNIASAGILYISSIVYPADWTCLMVAILEYRFFYKFLYFFIFHSYHN